MTCNGGQPARASSLVTVRVVDFLNDSDVTPCSRKQASPEGASTASCFGLLPVWSKKQATEGGRDQASSNPRDTTRRARAAGTRSATTRQ